MKYGAHYWIGIGTSKSSTPSLWDDWLEPARHCRSIMVILLHFSAYHVSQPRTLHIILTKDHTAQYEGKRKDTKNKKKGGGVDWVNPTRVKLAASRGQLYLYIDDYL